MEVLSISDIYQTRSNCHLDQDSYQVLLQLYQPLIGNEAVTLYLTLFSELNQYILTKKPSLVSRLCKVTQLSLTSLTQAFSKLEAVGLVNTFVKQNEHRYVFDMKMPLSANDFIHHQILNTLLKQRLHDEYEKTIIPFQTYHVNLDEYQDVSASFGDVFDIQLNQDNVLITKNYQSKQHHALEKEYDLTLFYQEMESFQLSKKMFQQSDIALIQQLGLLYKINELDMLEMVKKAMTHQRLDQKQLILFCRDYYDLKMPEKFEQIFHKQSPLLQQEEGSSSLEQHIHYLETISPYDLLKDKLGGREPLKRDLQVVESVLTDLQLEPGVMNVLIELTLVKCDQSLPRNFIEALASQWKRKKITTVKDAIEEGKAYLRYTQSQTIEESWLNQVPFQDDQQNDIEDTNEDLMKMLNSLYK